MYHINFMAKKKDKTPIISKKNLSKLQVFFIGIFIGLGLYWVPIDHEFSPAHFTQNEWQSQPVQSIFTEQFPITLPVIKRENYVLAYDGRTRNAHFVYHKLTPEVLDTHISRETLDFKEDPLIPEHLRATKKDYQGSGFDRGHLCAAADSLSQTAMEESFFLSNSSPQTPAFNRGFWKKIENHVRGLTKEYRVVHVFSGPLYLSSSERDGKQYVKYEVIGPHQVAVPTHFFTLIFVELPTKKMMTKAYIVPNKAIDPDTPLKKYLASVEEVESASGIMFTQILN